MGEGYSSCYLALVLISLCFQYVVPYLWQAYGFKLFWNSFLVPQMAGSRLDLAYRLWWGAGIVGFPLPNKYQYHCLIN